MRVRRELWARVAKNWPQLAPKKSHEAQLSDSRGQECVEQYAVSLSRNYQVIS